MINLSASYRNIVSNSMLTGFSILLLLSFLSMSSIQTNNLIAAVDVDIEEDGRAAAFDGEESIATDGDNFCSIRCCKLWLRAMVRLGVLVAGHFFQKSGQSSKIMP